MTYIAGSLWITYIYMVIYLPPIYGVPQIGVPRNGEIQGRTHGMTLFEVIYGPLFGHVLVTYKAGSS